MALNRATEPTRIGNIRANGGPMPPASIPDNRSGADARQTAPSREKGLLTRLFGGA